MKKFIFDDKNKYMIPYEQYTMENNVDENKMKDSDNKGQNSSDKEITDVVKLPGIPVEHFNEQNETETGNGLNHDDSKSLNGSVGSKSVDNKERDRVITWIYLSKTT